MVNNNLINVELGWAYQFPKRTKQGCFRGFAVYMYPLCGFKDKTFQVLYVMRFYLS